MIFGRGDFIPSTPIQRPSALRLVVAALPTLLIYIFLGKYFLRGLMAGALKG